MGALIIVLICISRGARFQHKVGDPGEAPGATIAEMNEERDEIVWRTKHMMVSRDKTREQLQDLRLQLGHIEDHEQRLRTQLEQLVAAELALTKGNVANETDERLRSEVDRLRDEIAKAEADVADARERANSRRPSYAIIPYQGPNQTRRRPIYIECTGERVILQPENIELTPNDFAGPMGPGNPLAAALRAEREYLYEMQDAHQPQEEPYPLLLIRPDGVDAYGAAREAMTSWSSDFGYELIDQDWKLEFQPPNAGLATVTQTAIDEARLRQQYLARAMPREANEQKWYRATNGGGVREDGGGRVGRRDSQTRSGRGGSGPTESFAQRGGGGGRSTRGGNGYGGGGYGDESRGGSDEPGAYATGGSAAGKRGNASGADGPNPYAGIADGGGGTLGAANQGGNAQGGNGSQSGGPGRNGVSGGQIVQAPTLEGGAPFPSGKIPNGGTAGGNGTNRGYGREGASGGPGTTGDATGSDPTGRATGPEGQYAASGSPPGVPGGGPDGGGDGRGSGGGTQGGSGGTGDEDGAGSAGKTAGGSQPAGTQSGGGAAGTSGGAPGTTAGATAGGSGGSNSTGQTSGGAMPTIQVGSQDSKNSPESGLTNRAGKGGANSSSSGGRGGGSGSSSMASRGKDWGLPENSRGAVPIARPIVIDCLPDKLIVRADGAQSKIVKEIPLSGATSESIDELVGAISDHSATWGPAGRGMYWKPNLAVQVAPGADGRFADLQNLMADSGLEVRQSQAPPKQVTKPKRWFSFK